MQKPSANFTLFNLGPDRENFSLNRSNALLTSNIVFDREKKSKYELIIQASENCQCDNYKDSCDFNKSAYYDSSSLSRVKVKIYIDDLNDNKPYFTKKLFIAGLAADANYGDVVLEGEVIIGRLT